MSEQKNEVKPVEGPQQPAETQTQPAPPPAAGGWSVPQRRIPEPMDIARRLGEMDAKPMKPLGALPPDADIADLLGKMMEPPEAPTMQMDVIPPSMDPSAQPTPRMGQFAFTRQRAVQPQVIMTCPAGYVGMCLACHIFPCMALKAKVLEVAAMDYRMQTMTPSTPIKT